MKTQTTPTEELVARLKAEKIIPADHKIIVEVYQWSKQRRELQGLYPTVISHSAPGSSLFNQIFSSLEVVELNKAPRWAVLKGEIAELIAEPGAERSE